MARSTFRDGFVGVICVAVWGASIARPEPPRPVRWLPEQKGMTSAHLHRIYQSPPPLEKPWPPATLSEWEQQRPYYRQAVQRMLNLPEDEKRAEWPLNLRYTKPDLKTPAFTVKYVVYESQPDVQVAANLYLPNDATFPAPAVLALQGHSVDGKAADYMQPLILNLVNKGYVVLTKDGFGRGERFATGHPIPPDELPPRTKPFYNQKAPFTYMSGISLDGLETWDAIRGIDVLCSDDLSQWVDIDRIAVAGMSGGAMQTFNLALVDERIKAAAAICNPNTFTAEFSLWEHCICCVCTTGIRRVAEQYHLLALAAPRPFLVCSGTTDKNHPLQGAQELVRQTKHVYDLYGAGENVQLIVDDVEHELAPAFRRAVYAFFNRHLNVDATDTDDPVTPLSRQTLNCGLAGNPMTVAALVYQASLPLPPDKGIFNSAAALRQYQRELAHTIRNDVFGYAAYIPQKCPLKSEIHEKTDKGDYQQELVTYYSEPDILLSAIFSYPTGRSNLPALISLGHTSEQTRTLIKAGYAVLSVQVRPRDGVYRSYSEDWSVWARGTSCGKPSAGMRVYDVLRAIDYLETRTEIVDRNRIGCLGAGSTLHAMYALYAAALDDRVACTLLERPVVTYKPETERTSSWHAWDLDMYIPGILLHADVSQVASLVAPRPLLVVDARDIGNQRLTPAEVEEKLASCRKAYDMLGGSSRLSVVDDAVPTDYISWLDEHL